MRQILYVEDEPFLAKIVKETLEQAYKVIHVADGAKALRQFKSHQIDICILDVMLPNKSGFEIANEIKAISKVPILFLTAKNQTEDVVQGFKVGGNDYIKKPFSMEELIVRVENLLALYDNRNEELNQKIMLGAKYIFEPSKLLLSIDGQVKRLSHKECQILEILCQNKNQVTQRKAILLKAWEDDSFYNSRSLDVYITKLRSYLAKDSKVEIITLKGVGYQFLVGE